MEFLDLENKHKGYYTTQLSLPVLLLLLLLLILLHVRHLITPAHHGIGFEGVDRRLLLLILTRHLLLIVSSSILRLVRSLLLVMMREWIDWRLSRIASPHHLRIVSSSLRITSLSGVALSPHSRSGHIHVHHHLRIGWITSWASSHHGLKAACHGHGRSTSIHSPTIQRQNRISGSLGLCSLGLLLLLLSRGCSREIEGRRGHRSVRGIELRKVSSLQPEIMLGTRLPDVEKGIGDHSPDC